MAQTFRIIIASPPDRTYLVAEIWNECGNVAELNREKGPYRLEIYPNPSGEPWRLDLDDFTNTLTEAKSRLDERR